MFEESELSVEALVAQNLGDEDWQELIPHACQGCTRRSTIEVEHSHFEAEPNIDKFTPDQLHAVRYA